MAINGSKSTWKFSPAELKKMSAEEKAQRAKRRKPMPPGIRKRAPGKALPPGIQKTRGGAKYLIDPVTGKPRVATPTAPARKPRPVMPDRPAARKPRPAYPTAPALPKMPDKSGVYGYEPSGPVSSGPKQHMALIGQTGPSPKTPPQLPPVPPKPGRRVGRNPNPGTPRKVGPAKPKARPVKKTRNPGVGLPVYRTTK